MTGFSSVTYAYDSAGRRVKKTVSGQTTWYVYDGDTLLAEVDASGSLRTAYVWGALGLISDTTPLQMQSLDQAFFANAVLEDATFPDSTLTQAVALPALPSWTLATGGTPEPIGDPIAVVAWPTDRFYFFDGQGNTRLLVDGSGQVIDKGAYSAWGKPLAGFAPQTPFGYRGQWGQVADGESGLLHCGARYYAPALGRWLSRDPSGFACGPNLYAYCADDPANFFDATGCEEVENEEPVVSTVINTIRPLGPYSSVVGDLVGLHDDWQDWGDAQGKFDAGKIPAWQLAYYGGKAAIHTAATATGIYGAAKAGLGMLGKAGAARGASGSGTTGCFPAGTLVAGFASGGAFGTGLASTTAPLSAVDNLLGGSAAISSAVVMPSSTLFGSLPAVSASDAPTFPIQDYRVGDWIASRNAVTGQTEWKQIERVSVRQVDTLVCVHLCDKQTGAEVQAIEATRQHPFYVEGKGFVPAGGLAVGNAIVTRAGPPLVVSRIEWEHKAEGWDVFNFVVAEDHSYFVGTANGGAWVHNGAGYRDTFFEAHPEVSAEDTIVHHSVEQQVLHRYPGRFTEEEIHALDNLRGIPRNANSRLHLSALRKVWNGFYRRHPNATREQIQRFANIIDQFFGGQFRPRR